MSVNEFGSTWLLTLAQVLYSAEHVTLDCLGVFDLLLNNGGSGVSILNSFMVDGFLNAVQQSLFTETERVSFWFTLNNWVRIPVILAAPLLSWVVVAVGTFVHLSVVVVFITSTAGGVQDFLSVDNVLGRQTESSLAVFSSLGPLVVAGVTMAKGLTLNRLVLAFHDVVELVGEASQVLSADRLVNVIRKQLRLTIGVALWDVLLIFAQTGVHLNLTWVHMCQLAVLQNLAGRAWVASALLGVLVHADAVIRVVAIGGDVLTCGTNAADRIRLGPLNWGCRR